MNKLTKWGVGFASALGFAGSTWAVTPYDSLVQAINFADLQTNVLIIIGLLVAFALVKNGGVMLYNLIRRFTQR